MKFIPDSDNDINSIKKSLEIDDVRELINIPKEIYLEKFPTKSIPQKGLSEQNLFEKAQNLISKNKEVEYYIGAGMYNHYIPAVVDELTSRSEFYTSYTPYQAEMSQGYLQAMFEYQSAIARLTNMDVSNSSLYDGATALVEAVIMAKNIKQKNEIILFDNIHPEYIKVLHTYNIGQSFQLKTVSHNSGEIDIEKLKTIISDNTAAVVIQNPNFFGIIENVKKVSKIVKEKNILLITIFYPISLGIIAPPGDYGTDIAVAEGQSFGNPPSMGGPGLGIMATKKEYVRKMPGRIVGLTRDKEGKIGFTLTLQAREQHIRRSKATSNICSNHALMALRSLIYLSALGDNGLKNLASKNLKNAHIVAEFIQNNNIAKLKFDKPFFNEFVLEFESEKNLNNFRNKLKKKNILFGLKLDKYFKDMKNCLLVTVTEMNNIKKVVE